MEPVRKKSPPFSKVQVARTPLVAHIPRRRSIVLRHLAIDFNGTLAENGKLLPGMAKCLRKAARTLHIVVTTTDTFGTAAAQLAGLPVEVVVVKTGNDKARVVSRLGARHVVAIGNGRNDVAMFEAATLAIAVIGSEGASSQALNAADVVVCDAGTAMTLLLCPLRLTATLRD